MRLCLLIAVLALLFPVIASAQSPCVPPVLNAVQVEEHTSGFDIDLDYPVLCSATATRILRDFATTELAAFKLEAPAHDLSDYQRRHTMDMRYAVWTAGKGAVASVKMHTTEYTGGAHPNNWPNTFVFDLATGKRLFLNDIFADVPHALATLAPKVRTVLNTSLGQMALPDMLRPGTEPTKGNYDQFILTDKGVAFFFAPYQVAPYAAGEQVVTIPYADLSDLLLPETTRLLSLNQ